MSRAEPETVSLADGADEALAQQGGRAKNALLAAADGGTAMGAEAEAQGPAVAQRCGSCGAALAEIVTACPFCGARMANLVSLEEETRVFLKSMEIRLADALAAQPDGLMVPALFAFLVAGPGCYLVLDSYTDFELLARIGLAVLAWFVALLGFGRQVWVRGERAEAQVWKSLVLPAVRRYIEQKGFGEADFLSQASLLLGETSQLRRMLLRRLGG
jgi:hypothetical protein